MRRVALVHPDVGGGAADAALLNDAYKVLLDPLARADALLIALHAPVTDARALPDGFLLEMMELRERLDAADGDATELESLAREGARMRDAAQDSLTRAFQDGNVAGQFSLAAAQSVRQNVNVMRAVARMLEQLAQHASQEGS